MINNKQLLTSLGIFVGVYVILILPMFGGAKTYADFYRKQAYSFFHDFGNNGFVVFEEHEDNGSDDTRVFFANKTMADAKGNVESSAFNISTRILAYLPNILLISLFAATPVKLWKRALMLLGGFLILHIVLMSFLYILILCKYLDTARLNMYQDMGKTSQSMLHYLNGSVNHGMGLNNFLVVLIWAGMVFYFERNVLSKFILQAEKTT